MIKFNKLILLLLLNFTLISIKTRANADPQVNIEILNIVTNGLVLPNNTFSFNGVEELEIEFDIKLSYSGTNTKFITQGILNNYYYEPNAFNNETAQYYDNGVHGRFLFQKENITLVHNNLGIYSYTFRQKMRLKKSMTYTQGSTFVLYYRSENLRDVVISNKLTCKLIGGTTTGKEPYKAPTANINLTKLSYSDGSPIINNTIVIPDNEGDEIGSREINLSFNYNCSYGSKLISSYYPSYIIQIRHSAGGSTSLFPKYENIINTNGTGTINITNLKIPSTNIGPSDFLRILFNFQGIQIDLKCAVVKGNYEKPIRFNIISDSQTIKYGQTAAPFNTNSPYQDYTVPCNRRNCPGRDLRHIETFKWQSRTQNSNWSDIPNATSLNYSPTKSFTENTYYRRLAFNGSEQYSISNIVSIIIENTNIKNTVCCDQLLPNIDSQPQQITGNISTSGTQTYQWQYAKDQMGYLDPWHDLIGATNQNYTHVFTQNAMTSNEKTLFRRIIKENSLPIHISNPITIIRNPAKSGGSGGRSQRAIASTQTTNYINIFDSEVNENDINNTLIYPNPFLNSFSIEGPIQMSQIKLYDSYGQIINVSKYEKSENLIEVNTTNLQPGIFILKVDNTSFSKTLYKN